MQPHLEKELPHLNLVPLLEKVDQLKYWYKELENQTKNIPYNFVRKLIQMYKGRKRFGYNQYCA